MKMYRLLIYDANHHIGQRFPRFISCDPFPTSARFTRRYAIDFLVYLLHNVGYILKQEGILQRPAIPFIHCEIVSL